MAPIRVRLEANGRILLPAEVRRQLAVEPGDMILMTVDDDGVRLWTQDIAVRRLREHLARVIPPNVSLVDELLKMRRDDQRGFEQKYGLTKTKTGRGRK